jgi:tetratricopeptide (TPR) repeat protein
MPSNSFWSRLRSSRLLQVLLVYLGASWLVVQVVSDLRGMLDLPPWIGPVTLILLSVGLLIMLATAWVQSHPQTDAREAAAEVPRPWQLDLGEAVASVRRGRLPHLTWSRALVGGVVAFSLLFGVAGMYVLVRGDGGVFRTRELSAEAAPDGVAVLPFTVRGAALEEWREGMVDLLSTGLDGAGGLRAIASRTVLARWHESVDGTAAADEQVALDVARRVGARYALLGSAVAIGPRVRLALDVYELDGEGRRRLGQAQVEGAPDSVLVLVDQLALQTLALVLRQARADLPQVDLASMTTTSLPALKSYLEGESLFRRGDFEAAAAAYDRATSTDTLFGLAYWRLSQALGWNESIQSPRGAEANQRALQLVDRLPPREALLARATMHTRRGEIASVAMLQEAVRKYPDDAEAWYQLGDAYFHLPGALVGWDEVEEAFERAVALAPRVVSYRIHLLEGAFRNHADSALVRARLSELERLAPNSPQTRRFRLAERLAFGDSTARDSAVVAVMEARHPTLGGQVNAALSHPRFVDVRRHHGERAYPNVPAPVRASIVRDRGWGHLSARGRMSAAFDAFRDPALQPHEWGELVLVAHLAGIPVTRDDLERAAAEADLRGPAAFVAGAYAASRQQWDTHARAVAVLRTRADSLASAGDSLRGRSLGGDASLLEGYALWRRGRTAEAAAMMEAARVLTPSEFGRWWLGQLHMEAGRWREAEPYFRSFMKWDPDPFSAYHLGQIYEATGRLEQARGMYAFFTEQWHAADPAVRPLVDDARDRLQRLSADR